MRRSGRDAAIRGHRAYMTIIDDYDYQPGGCSPEAMERLHALFTNPSPGSHIVYESYS